jgi:hypothetical protein
MCFGVAVLNFMINVNDCFICFTQLAEHFYRVALAVFLFQTNRPVHLQSRSKSTRRRVKKSISALEPVVHEELTIPPPGICLHGLDVHE